MDQPVRPLLSERDRAVLFHLAGPGRDGFWLARWLIARGIEAHVIHSASVAVSRERKRANRRACRLRLNNFRSPSTMIVSEP